MRVFIAIELDAGLKDFLASIGRQLEGSSGGGRFTDRDNVHLTLKFIGEADEALIRKLAQILDALAKGFEPFRLALGGLGRFPRGGRSILWMGVEQSPELKRLFRQLERELGSVGISPEERPFTPHITLGRQVVLTRDFGTLAASIPPERPEIRADGLSLMESARVEGRLVYRPLHKSPFRG